MRKRKSARGCIVGHDLAILNLVLVKKGDADVEGLTDGSSERRLGPKRASKIKKLWGLGKDDDVRKFVVRREIKGEEDKVKRVKAPKIQRLVTPLTLQRRRAKKNSLVKKVVANRAKRTAYAEKMASYRQEAKEKRQAEMAKKKAGGKKKGKKGVKKNWANWDHDWLIF